MKQMKLSKLQIAGIILASFLISRIIMYVVYGLKFSDTSLLGFIRNINVWDAGWYSRYVYVICDGTFFQAINSDTGQAIWGFFPGYPVLLALIWKLLGSSIDVCILGSIVSSVCFMASEYIAYLYIKDTRDDDRIALYYILFMSFGPYSFYYSSTYTEGLFMLLVVGFLYCMRKDKYLLMGLCGAMLSATRSVGVMIAFVLLAHCVIEYIGKYGEFCLKNFVVENIKKRGMVIGALLIPMGLFSYMYYLYQGLGDAIAFVHIEEAWDRAPFKTIRNPKDAFFNNAYGRYMFLVLVGVLIVLIWEYCVWKRYEEMVYPVIILLMSLPTSTQGFPRYMFSCFFVVLFCCDIFRSLKPPFRYCMAGVTVLYELLLIWMWLGGEWAVLC